MAPDPLTDPEREDVVGGDRLGSRLGLSIPNEWWPAQPMLKEIEASGFAWVQVHSPPASVLADPRSCIRHGQGLARSIGATRLRTVLHAPGDLLAGEPGADRALAGALAHAAECGAEIVVVHARTLQDGPAAEDRMLAEARSLATLAGVAERLSVTLALENLAPVFPGPETISANPLALRSLVRRIGSPALRLCLDVGHANVIAGLRRTSLPRMIEPVLDAAALFHVHDNLGARWHAADRRPELDPLRLDLHLAPGRGSIEWSEIAASLLSHDAPLLLEIHPPRGAPQELAEAARTALLTPSGSPRTVEAQPEPRPTLR